MSTPGAGQSAASARPPEHLPPADPPADPASAPAETEEQQNLHQPGQAAADPDDEPESERTAAPPSAVDDSAGSPPLPLLSRSDQLLVAILCAVTLVLIGIRQYRVQQWGRPPAAVIHPGDGRIGIVLEINTATWVEWIQLEGIGETLARRIVDDRETNGPFDSVDDLQRVRGIGPKTVERLRPWLKVDSATAGEAADVETADAAGPESGADAGE
jgi:competence protein ComEA